jgi:hypothetical protein
MAMRRRTPEAAAQPHAGIHDELLLHLRARATLVVLVTVEEQRALAVLDQVRRDLDFDADLVVWDPAARMRSMAGRKVPEATTVESALDRIGDLATHNPGRPDVYAVCDLHESWDRAPAVRRKLRSLAHRLTSTRATLVAVSPTPDVPRELADEAVVVDLPLPDLPAMRVLLDHLVATTPGVRVELDSSGRDAMARAALGLTASQAQRAFARALVRDRVLDAADVDAVLAEKQAVVRATPGLEFIDDTAGGHEVGGLEHLKEWLALRRDAFGARAEAFGLPCPKGIALVGIPGSGKSMTARMVGRMWQLPVLRLDMGGLFDSKLGETEHRTRRALRVAEAVAPSVLWIDEVEKVLSHGDQDGGTSMRVLGTVLTWMQERPAPVFVVATANDVSRVPPELLRRGRFDEVFFLDLPNEAERAEILRVQLRRRGRDPQGFDLGQLARLSAGHVGAELEQAVTDALFCAFGHGRELTTADLAAAISATIPLSLSSKERVAALRAWQREGRARPASASSGPHPELKLA